MLQELIACTHIEKSLKIGALLAIRITLTALVLIRSYITYIKTYLLCKRVVLHCLWIIFFILIAPRHFGIYQKHWWHNEDVHGGIYGCLSMHSVHG